MSTASRFPNRSHGLNGEEIARLLRGGADYLYERRELVDAMNVFPVPDGDTGTNMALTLQACTKALPEQAEPAGKMAALAAKGALLGARGNSGVIFSQLFWGWAKALEGRPVVSARDWAQAMEKGVELAYQAVIKPVEGTILTVARAAAKAATKTATRANNLEEVLAAAIDQGQRALAMTPDLLPALKDAGVVDAGGQGYLFFLEGCFQVLKGGEAILSTQPGELTARPAGVVFEHCEPVYYPYCTEFVLRGRHVPVEVFRYSLQAFGDCLLVVGDEEVVKVHIHTDHPGKILEKALPYGSLHEIHISNMQEQTIRQGEKNNRSQVPVAFVTAAPSAGWGRLFTEQGAVQTVMGGAAHNPSAQEWVKAIEATATDFTILLPNHPNLILAARQAAQICGTEKVGVVPSRHLPGGLAAALAFDPQKTAAENKAAMETAAGRVHAVEITRAVRDAVVNGHQVKCGEILGLVDDTVAAHGVELESVVLEAVGGPGREWELITVFTGEDLTAAVAEQLSEVLAAAYPQAEVEILPAGQPLYPLIIGLE
ncbi:MAG: DAK2 domain-containing protein [Heliobacteriaceae bacterium]|nr:DAK2 domain-containing protein [Heliobacteriaceae bacterium]MDD4586996.1 DAK2 domain-containing protein [Heliobacteriaceae bacterium]